MIKLILNRLRRYRDQWGLITQKDKDGGDTCQRTGSAYALMAALGCEVDDRDKPLVEGFLYDLDKLRVAPGRYVRHPIANEPVNGRYTPWYGNPNNFTRDQSVVLQAAMVLLGTTKELRELFEVRKKNKFLHFNTESYDEIEEKVVKFPDIPAPIEFAQFIRGLDLWYLRPLLYILDLQLLTDLYFRQRNIRNLWDSDNMMLPVILSCLCKWPTFWGKLARKLYAKTDAANRYREYYSEAYGRNGINPLGDLYETAFYETIEKYK